MTCAASSSATQQALSACQSLRSPHLAHSLCPKLALCVCNTQLPRTAEANMDHTLHDCKRPPVDAPGLVLNQSLLHMLHSRPGLALLVSTGTASLHAALQQTQLHIQIQPRTYTLAWHAHRNRQLTQLGKAAHPVKVTQSPCALCSFCNAYYALLDSIQQQSSPLGT